jgi:hypothetical protein
LGNMPTATAFIQTKKGMQRAMLAIRFTTPKEIVTINVPEAEGKWFVDLLQKTQIQESKIFTYQEVKADFEKNGLADFELFWDNKPISKLKDIGLLTI